MSRIYLIPPNGLENKTPRGGKDGAGWTNVGEQLDLISKLGDQAAHAKVVRRTIFNCLITAESSDILARGHYGLSKSELHPIQLPSHKDSREEVGDHPYRLQFLDERGFFGRDIQTSGCSNLRIAERRGHGSQVIRLDPDVAIGDYQQLVRSFVHQADQPGNLVIDRTTTGAEKQANTAFGKILYQFFQNWQCGIVRIHTKKNFVFGIVLVAEACVILVGVRVESLDGLQTTYRRREVRTRGSPLPA